MSLLTNRTDFPVELGSLAQDLVHDNLDTTFNPALTRSSPPVRGFTSEVTGAIVEFVVTQVWGAITGIIRGLFNVVSREYTCYTTARAPIPIVTVMPVRRRCFRALATKNAVGVPGGTYKKHPTEAAAREAFEFARANDAVKVVRPKPVRTPPPPPPPSVTEDEGDDGPQLDVSANSSPTLSTSLPDAPASPAASMFASCPPRLNFPRPNGITEPIELDSEDDEDYEESEGYSEYAPSMPSDVDFYTEGGRFFTRR
ncbi:hypothetical protein BD410DRAFT_803859 [Rickenella mellea]|uniref:Uncharacterized protein n=1 Tax=Rickenella mellea TaxID=50990 RepID=A0A4Y7Q425_9AGAM|nr:hypothetical protein BD410DRAFT_803859 [Rickenella mellea]